MKRCKASTAILRPNHRRLGIEEWDSAMAEVLGFFAKYKPPARGYRPTAYYGKEQLCKGGVGGKEEEDEED